MSQAVPKSKPELSATPLFENGTGRKELHAPAPSSDSGLRYALERRSDLFLLSLALVPALILRAMLFGSQNGVVWPDSVAYLRWALDISSEGLFRFYPAYRTPGYSTFLAALFLVFSAKAHAVVVLAAQHLLGIATIVLTYCLARQQFSKTTAFFSALLLGTHTLQLYYERVYQTECLFMFLWMSTLLLACSCMKRPSLSLHMALALVCAALTLTRPVSKLIPVVICFALFLGQRKSRGSWKAAKSSAIYLLLYGILLVPWMSFNKQHHGVFSVTQDLGLNLYHRIIDVQRGKLPRKTKYPVVQQLALRERRRPDAGYFWVYHSLRRRGLSSIQADKLMLDYAWEVFRARPMRYLKRSLESAVAMFTDPRVSVAVCDGAFGPVLCCERHSDFSYGEFFPATFDITPPSDMIQRLRSISGSYFRNFNLPIPLLSGLALIAFAGFRTRMKKPSNLGIDVLCFGSIAYFVAVSSLLNWPEDRFRLPADPLLIIYGVAGAGLILKLLTRSLQKFRPAEPEVGPV